MAIEQQAGSCKALKAVRAAGQNLHLADRHPSRDWPAVPGAGFMLRSQSRLADLLAASTLLVRCHCAPSMAERPVPRATSPAMDILLETGKQCLGRFCCPDQTLLAASALLARCCCTPAQQCWLYAQRNPCLTSRDLLCKMLGRLAPASPAGDTSHLCHMGRPQKPQGAGSSWAATDQPTCCTSSGSVWTACPWLGVAD